MSSRLRFGLGLVVWLLLATSRLLDRRCGIWYGRRVLTYPDLVREFSGPLPALAAARVAADPSVAAFVALASTCLDATVSGSRDLAALALVCCQRLSLRTACRVRRSDFHAADSRLVVDRRDGPHVYALADPVARALAAWSGVRGPGPGPLLCRLRRDGTPVPAASLSVEGLRVRLTRRALAAALPGFDLDALRLGAAVWLRPATGTSSGLATLIPAAPVPAPIAIAAPGSESSSALASLIRSGDVAVGVESPALVYLAGLGSPASRRSMLSHLRSVAVLLFSDPDVRVSPWSELDVSSVTVLRARLADRYRPAAANVKLQALRGVVRTAWRLGALSTDLCHRLLAVPLVRGTRLPSGRSLSADELGQLFASCGTTGVIGARDAAVLALLYGAGLRLAEALAVRAEAFRFDGAASVTVVGKGSRERRVPLPRGAVEALGAWLRLLSPRDDGVPVLRPVVSDVPAVRVLSASGLSAALASRARRAGVRSFTAHDLRRTYITRLLESDADPLVVRRLAGHASVDTTVVYDRRGDQALTAAVAGLDVPYRLPRS